MTRVLIFISVLVFCVPVIFAKLREKQYEDRKFSLDVDSAEETIRAFRRRRKRAFLYLALGLVAGAATFALGTWGAAEILGLYFLAFGLEACLLTYCCPICYRTVVATSDQWADNTLDLMPVVCHKCGAPLSTRWLARKRRLPAALRDGPYRFYFYGDDQSEPPQVHIGRESSSAKFWLSPVVLATNLGFSPEELRELEQMVLDHRGALLEAWVRFEAEGR